MYTITLAQDQEYDLQLFLNRYKMLEDLENTYNTAKYTLKHGGDPVAALETILHTTQQYSV